MRKEREEERREKENEIKAVENIIVLLNTLWSIFH